VADVRRVCVDTSVFLSVFARETDPPERLEPSLWVLEAAQAGQHEIVVAASVIAEIGGAPVMRPPAKADAERRAANVARFANWLADNRFLVVDVDQRLASQAAQLGQQHQLSGGDACVLAAALATNCSALYAWDRDLLKLGALGTLHCQQPRALTAVQGELFPPRETSEAPPPGAPGRDE
jgi:predicted nucleic acid-binding protein